MARKPSPCFWPERNGWYTILNGQRQPLGEHPFDTPPQKRKGRWVVPMAIEEAFRKLLGGSPSSPASPATGGPSVAVEVVDKFLDWCQKHREARTYADYLDYIQKFLDHLGDKAAMPVAEIPPFHIIVEWVDAHDGWNDTTRRKAMIHVQRPFNFAAKLGYIPDNPVRHVEKPQAKRRDNPVTPEDFALMLAKVIERDPFRDLLLFNWYTGVRPQEGSAHRGKGMFISRQNASSFRRTRPRGKSVSVSSHSCKERRLRSSRDFFRSFIPRVSCSGTAMECRGRHTPSATASPN